MRFHFLHTVASTMLGVLAIGCSGNDGRNIKIVSVEGAVTLDEKPLQDGVVELFEQSTGFSSGAPLDANGVFLIERIPAGNYDVVVRPPYLPPPGETLPPRPSTMGPLRQIPVAYSNSKTSGFKLSVPTDGLTDVKLELKN